MKRLNQLLNREEYQKAQSEILELEQDRIYCGHGRAHFADVARIAYILALEEDLHLDKEIVYATAFLHDIGRAYEYRGECSHESGSVLMALNLLPECGFSEEEIETIVSAIATHRDKKSVKKGTLGAILYRADKLSRDCLYCGAKETCKWTEVEKNDQIKY